MSWTVDVRAEERTAVYASFFALLGMTAAHTLVETARDALFLAKVPASRLVWLYAMFAVLAAIIASGRERRGNSGNDRVAPGIVAGAAVTLAFWVALHASSHWLLYALYLWPGVFGGWITGVLWTAVGRSFSLTQAKRLFGPIGAGAVLGALVGAAASRLLAGLFAPQHLLLGAAAVLLLTGVGPARNLDHAMPALRGSAPRGARPPPPPTRFGRDARALFTDPFARRVLALVALSTIALTATDFLFKSAVAARIEPQRLGSFFADVSLVLNGLALVAQVFGVGLLLRALRVNRALAVMPFLLLLSALGVVAAPALAAALVLRGVDGTMRHSLHKTTTEILFVPLPPGRTKSLIELFGQRGGQILASICLLPLFALGGERALGVAVAALAAAWLLQAITIKKPYLDIFRKTLKEGRFEDASALPMLDVSALETLFAALNSDRDPEVLGALDLLAAQDRARLVPALILYHPSKPIVLRALGLLVAEKRQDFVPIADRLLAQHPDPEVRAACLRARTAVRPEEAFLRTLVGGGDGDPFAEVRATALAALVTHGWLSDEVAQREIALLRAGPREARSALARAASFEPSGVFEDALIALASDSDLEVRVEATRALGRVASPRFIPLLVAMLDGRREGAAAREALAEIGAPALAALDRTLGDRAAARDLRWGVARAIGHWRDPPAGADVLVRNLAQAAGDGMLEARIASALARLRAADPTVQIGEAAVSRGCDGAVRTAFFDLGHRLALERSVPATDPRRTPTFRLLTAMLRDDETHAIGRLCAFLGLLHPGESFARIERGLRSRNPKARASGRELIENIVAPPLRSAVLALVDDAPDSVRLSRAGAWAPAVPLDLAATVRALFEDRGDVGSVAAYYADECNLLDPAGPRAAVRDVLDPQLGAALAARTIGRPRRREASDV